jgi:hypothetical protein
MTLFKHKTFSPHVLVKIESSTGDNLWATVDASLLSIKSESEARSDLDPENGWTKCAVSLKELRAHRGPQHSNI